MFPEGELTSQVEFVQLVGRLMAWNGFEYHRVTSAASSRKDSKGTTFIYFSSNVLLWPFIRTVWRSWVPVCPGGVLRYDIHRLEHNYLIDFIKSGDPSGFSRQPSLIKHLHDLWPVWLFWWSGWAWMWLSRFVTWNCEDATVQRRVVTAQVTMVTIYCQVLPWCHRGSPSHTPSSCCIYIYFF